MKLNLRSILFAAFLSLLPVNVLAWDNVRLYPVYWSGINVGDLIIYSHQEGNTYKIRTIIKSKNIAKAISGYYNEAEATVTDNGGKIVPQSFETDLYLKKKKRQIKITYDQNGKVISDSNIPPENPGKRPLVAQDLKDGSFDPLSLAIFMREKLRTLRSSGEIDKGEVKFSVPLYDGRRRSNLNFTVHGRKTIEVRGRNIKVIHISFVNMPIAGYTKNEIRDMPAQNPIINAYIEDTDLLLPVKGDGETRIGFASGAMAIECTSLKNCPIDIRGRD